MNRIDKKFIELKADKRKAFIPYIMAGDPNLATTLNLVLAFEQAGADIIELGIPFSDPLADGVTIQAAAQRALKAKTTTFKVFDLVKKIRQRSQIPLAFMTYYNLVFHYGENKFIAKCKEVGIDGLIIPDLPPEEALNLRKVAAQANISIVFFIAPTSVNERIKANAAASTGFVYCVTLAGITGTQQAIAQSVIKNIKHAKRFTKKPICAGFGISTPQQVKEIAKVADGVIVASAIIKKMQEHAGSRDLVKIAARYVAVLSKALR